VGPSEFNGFTGTRDKRIVLVEDVHRQVLMIDGRPYMQWAIEDVLTKRLAIVQLHQLQLGSHEQLAAAFGISTKSVYNTIRIFLAEGATGLLTATRGPKSPWKLTPQVRGKVLQAFLKEGIIGYEAIRQRLAAGGEGVSTGSIRQVLLENGLASEAQGATDLAKPIELFHTEGDEQQLVFQFSRAEAWDRGMDVAKTSEPDPLAAGRQHNGGAALCRSNSQHDDATRRGSACIWIS
jgi:transposase